MTNINHTYYTNNGNHSFTIIYDMISDINTYTSNINVTYHIISLLRKTPNTLNPDKNNKSFTTGLGCATQDTLAMVTY